MTRWTDERMEVLIGTLLRAGVILAALVVGAGGVLYLIRHGMEHADFAAFHGEPPQYRSLGGILQSLLAGHARAVIQLGLLLLIATPVARVAFSVAGFAFERDRVYVGITLFVLAVLLYSLAGGA